jgi:hypothetical protein
MKTETELTPITSQRPTEGMFFSSESAEKSTPDGRPKRDLKMHKYQKAKPRRTRL